MRAIEITGSVDEEGFVQLDQPLAEAKLTRFRGILLFPEVDNSQDQEWSLSAIQASTGDLLDDPEEDIYTLEDGEPLDDEA
ncbi:hypothetical protein [Myxacorys almedinensis]|uniref:Uncharacterized protein n=1 Tax=Myxacorys almedinensis A TaxID=2690445 RepID=A0A8J7YWH0_9CYAN|nr:hypothetical protein [Myxacorys almedinensis]NDJ15942.1 hypothetical protein [Myxacorys almedinensis A]